MGRKNRRDNIRLLAVGSAVAAVAGYVAGILTAPKSGKQTREGIKSVADKGVGEAEKELKKLNAELNKVITEAKEGGNKMNAKAKEELNDLVNKAKDSKEKVREMISAVREGEASDKDLDRALQEGVKALKHLRTYLKK